jgi:Cu(I)/Ag(I) efflux system membrane protein CusA/SilA
MINKIIYFSDKNRFLIFLFVAVAIVLGWNAMRNTKLDAIPDLSDTQVIVYAKWDRSPDIMEDQVSYPIASALLGMPKVKDILYLHHLRRRNGPLLGAGPHARIPELRHSAAA